LQGEKFSALSIDKIIQNINTKGFPEKGKPFVIRKTTLIK